MPAGSQCVSSNSVHFNYVRPICCSALGYHLRAASGCRTPYWSSLSSGMGLYWKEDVLTEGDGWLVVVPHGSGVQKGVLACLTLKIVFKYEVCFHDNGCIADSSGGCTFTAQPRLGAPLGPAPPLGWLEQCPAGKSCLKSLKTATTTVLEV